MRRATILIALAVVGLAGCSLGGESEQEAAIRAESGPPPSPSSPGPAAPADPSLKPTENVPVSASPEPEGTATSLGDEPPGKSDEPPGKSQDRFKTLDEAVAAGSVDTPVADALGDSGEVEAIVTFEHRSILANAQTNAPEGAGRSEAVLQSIKPAYKALKARAMGRVQAKATVLEEYENLAVLLVRFESEDALLSVANAPGVTGIRENREVPVLLQESLPLIRQPQLPAGNTGSGVSVAVIDTGVAYDQYPGYFGTCTAPGSPSSCRVKAAYEAAANDGQTDANGHGSHVASIISSVAPGAGIISVDVFGSTDAEGNTLTETGAIAKAVNWIVGQRAAYNIEAMNLSLGGGWETGACSQTQTYSDGQDTADFATARGVGILPVVAAGNSKYNDDGVEQLGIGWPACVPGALSVGATYDDYLSYESWRNCYDFPADVDQVVCFSQTGDNLDMLAPGAEIDAAGGVKAGTSMAAPHVAGAVAVLAASRPSATVQQLESSLASTGPLITDPTFPTVNPKRRLDLPAALSALPTVDSTAPAVTAPTQDVSLYWSLGTTVVPVTVSWSATDSSGIAAYALSVSTNGGAYAAITLPTATTRSLTFNLTPGGSYRFRAGAQDGAGNWSVWVYGPTFTVDVHQETSTSITYSGTWTRLAWTPAYGGYQKTASATNAWAKLSFTGRGVGWVAPVATNRGKAYVYVDGVYVQTLDLYAATTTARKVVFSRSWPSSAAHTITVQVVGTAGRPAIDVDAFAVLR